MGFTNWQERAEKAEDVLRSLAGFVGAGGYNADKVDADVFEQKIRWGIGQIMERLEKAEAELVQLREQTAIAQVEVAHGFHKRTTNWLKALPDGTHLLFTGPVAAPAVPAPSVPEEWREVMAKLVGTVESSTKFHGCDEVTKQARTLLQSSHVTDSVAAKQSQIDSLAVPDNFRAAAMSYLSAVDKFNALNSTVGGGWSTKKAGTHQEIVLAANEMHGRRMLLESLLQSAEVRHDDAARGAK